MLKGTTFGPSKPFEKEDNGSFTSFECLSQKDCQSRLRTSGPAGHPPRAAVPCKVRSGTRQPPVLAFAQTETLNGGGEELKGQWKYTEHRTPQSQTVCMFVDDVDVPRPGFLTMVCFAQCEDDSNIIFTGYASGYASVEYPSPT